MSEEEKSPFEEWAIQLEEVIMTRLVPMNNPGPVFKWLFKVPILFYKIGLPLFGNFILLITTTGRKTGKLRHTPLEYRREDGSGYFIIMSGWGGYTDWYRNALANPKVHVQAGWKKFNARAEKVDDEQVAEWLTHVAQVNPSSLKIWSRWAGEKLDASYASMLKAAKHFPSLRLKPLEEDK